MDQCLNQSANHIFNPLRAKTIKLKILLIICKVKNLFFDIRPLSSARSLLGEAMLEREINCLPSRIFALLRPTAEGFEVLLLPTKYLMLLFPLTKRIYELEFLGVSKVKRRNPRN